MIPDMTAADGIRRLGFRRWYERQLIESHGFLVTGFLSMIAMVACVEELSPRAPGGSLIASLALIAGCAVLCAWSLRRYHVILNRAEYLGERSTCSSCAVYGALEIVQSGSISAAEASDSAPWLKVRCRKCGHQWTIE
jgi:hypothetical protein